MYDAESYFIPDSDAKIYMSLDDIIKLENIRKPGPGSVRSVASRRSNKSHHSTYSTRSNRSRRSNYSARSNRSRRSTYSNWSNRSHHSALSNRSQRSAYGDQVHVLSHSNAFRRGQTITRYRNPYQHLQHRNSIQQGYNSKPQFTFYRNTVKNAVRRLTNRVSKQHLGRFRGQFKRYNYSQKFLQSGSMLPRDISVELQNNRVHPLTRRSLEIFNQSHNNNRVQRNPRSNGTRTIFSNCPSHISYSKRHSVQNSINQNIKKEILIVQNKAKSNSNSEDLTNLEFSPTPHFTSQLINDRFSLYDWFFISIQIVSYLQWCNYYYFSYWLLLLIFYSCWNKSTFDLSMSVY